MVFQHFASGPRGEVKEPYLSISHKICEGPSASVERDATGALASRLALVRGVRWSASDEARTTKSALSFAIG
jgi:hypothetical protein